MLGLVLVPKKLTNATNVAGIHTTVSNEPTMVDKKLVEHGNDPCFGLNVSLVRGIF